MKSIVAAQGGAQGFEDAAALSVLLPKDTPVTAINSRLRLFEEIRRPRCMALQLNSYAMAEESPFVKGHSGKPPCLPSHEFDL